GCRIPVSIFSVVDLPAPFGPMNATRSPRRISKEIPRTAGISSAGDALNRPKPFFLGLDRKLLHKFSTAMANMMRTPFKCPKAKPPAGNSWRGFFACTKTDANELASTQSPPPPCTHVSGARCETNKGVAFGLHGAGTYRRPHNLSKCLACPD